MMDRILGATMAVGFVFGLLMGNPGWPQWVYGLALSGWLVGAMGFTAMGHQK